MNRIKLILIAFVLIASISIASATDVGGVIMTDTTWNASGSPYNVIDDVTVVNRSTDVTLTIEPGVTVNFSEGAWLWIGANGKLNASGTSEEKITFTGTEKTPGHWKGIVFGPFSNDTSAIDNAIIEYGGGDWFSGKSSEQCFTTSSHANVVQSLTENQINQIKTHGISLRANIMTICAAPTINGSTIRNSAGDGILCIYRSMDSSSTPAATCCFQDPTITCNWITNNTNGVHTLLRAEPKINDNNICDNSDYGVLNTKLGSWWYPDPPAVNAKNNWWGANDGPSGEGSGSGDAVSKYVDYSGWTTDPVPCAPIPELSSIILVAAGIMMLAGCARIGRRD